VTSARIVSDAFDFDFSHATCGGVSQTGTRSVFFSPAPGFGFSLFFFAAMSTSTGQFSKLKAS
jgi:hypothetical protein